MSDTLNITLSTSTGRVISSRTLPNGAQEFFDVSEPNNVAVTLTETEHAEVVAALGASRWPELVAGGSLEMRQQLIRETARSRSGVLRGAYTRIARGKCVLCGDDLREPAQCRCSECGKINLEKLGLLIEFMVVFEGKQNV